MARHQEGAPASQGGRFKETVHRPVTTDLNVDSPPSYEELIEEHLAEAKASGTVDFGSTAEVDEFVQGLLPPGVKADVVVTHRGMDGQMKLGAKGWVTKVDGRWLISIRPEKATTDVVVHEVAHVVDVERHGWPSGATEGVDMTQRWAHGPTFEESLRELNEHVGYTHTTSP